MRFALDTFRDYAGAIDENTSMFDRLVALRALCGHFSRSSSFREVGAPDRGCERSQQRPKMS